MQNFDRKMSCEVQGHGPQHYQAEVCAADVWPRHYAKSNTDASSHILHKQSPGLACSFGEAGVGRRTPRTSGAVLGDITNIVGSRGNEVDGRDARACQGCTAVPSTKTWMHSGQVHPKGDEFSSIDIWEDEFEPTCLPEVDPSGKWDNSDDNIGFHAWQDQEGSAILIDADCSLMSPLAPELMNGEEPDSVWVDDIGEVEEEEEEEDLDILDLEEELSRQLGQSLEFDLQDEHQRDVLNDILGTPRTPSPRGCKPMFSTSAGHDGPETEEAKPRCEQSGSLPQQGLPCCEAAPAEAEQDAAPSRDYIPDLLRRMLAREAAGCPAQNFLQEQKEVDAHARRQVVDMVVQVHFHCALSTETLFLAISTLDRYLSRVQVQHSSLYIAGMASLIAAAKFQEAGVPLQTAAGPDKELVHMLPCPASRVLAMIGTSDARKQILEVECEVLQAIGFDLAVPTAASFVAHFGDCSACGSQQIQLANYLLELALFDEGIWTAHPPSRLAVASLALAAQLTGGRAPWPSSMDARAGAQEAGLSHCTLWLRMLHGAAAASGFQTVRRKYSLPQFCEVAKVVPQA